MKIELLRISYWLKAYMRKFTTGLPQYVLYPHQVGHPRNNHYRNLRIFASFQNNFSNVGLKHFVVLNLFSITPPLSNCPLFQAPLDVDK